MPSVAETALEMIQLVLPEHANTRGTLYGGVMMNWITTAATMAAMKVARGTVVLGRMDDLDFVAPVAIGDLVTLRAQVEYTGRSSLGGGGEGPPAARETVAGLPMRSSWPGSSSPRTPSSGR